MPVRCSRKMIPLLCTGFLSAAACRLGFRCHLAHPCSGHSPALEWKPPGPGAGPHTGGGTVELAPGHGTAHHAETVGTMSKTLKPPLQQDSIVSHLDASHMQCSRHQTHQACQRHRRIPGLSWGTRNVSSINPPEQVNCAAEVSLYHASAIICA